MRLITYIVLLFFSLLVCTGANGQAAASTSTVAVTSSLPEKYFHEGARLYINNKKDSALRIINKGLKIEPENKKLKELAKKILQEQKQKKKDQEKEKEKKQEKQKKEEKKKEEQKQNKDISKEDAKRLLEAMNNDEKKLRQKMNQRKMKAVKIPIEKDW